MVDFVSFKLLFLDAPSHRKSVAYRRECVLDIQRQLMLASRVSRWVF